MYFSKIMITMLAALRMLSACTKNTAVIVPVVPLAQENQEEILSKKLDRILFDATGLHTMCLVVVEPNGKAQLLSVENGVVYDVYHPKTGELVATEVSMPPTEDNVSRVFSGKYKRLGKKRLIGEGAIFYAPCP